ncbi:MAG: hypothetical protein AAFP97_12210 [Pseudomonadota bacterium]
MTKFVQTFMIATLAGTSLSGCAVFNGKEVWPGERTFVQFMTTPIGELLRRAPAEETQFANETTTEETVVEVAENSETFETVEVTEAIIHEDALAWDDVVEDYLDAPLTRTQTNVQAVETTTPAIEIIEGEVTTRVLSNEELRALLRSSGSSTTYSGTSTHSGMSTVKSGGAVTTTQTVAPITQTVTVTESSYAQSGSEAGLTQADLQSMLRHSGGIKTKYKQSEYAPLRTGVKTVSSPATTTIHSSSSSMSSSSVGRASVDHAGLQTTSSTTTSTYATVDTDISYVRMGGGASLEDWRACEAKFGNYWAFDDDTHVGMLNPDFERCMTSQDYEVETSIKTEIIQPTSAPVTTTRTTKLQ